MNLRRKNPQYSIVSVINALFILIAFLIIGDFILPGAEYNDEIMSIQKERQDYFNAARNYHYSTEVVTTQHRFSVSEEFGLTAKEKDEIEYSVSQLFNEVNWYRSTSSQSKSFYSLRMMSGLIIPLSLLISLFVVYRLKKNLSTLVFVLKLLILADLIFLMI